jgi:hypothetical protein
MVSITGGGGDVRESGLEVMAQSRLWYSLGCGQSRLRYSLGFGAGCGSRGYDKSRL